jgi:pteridine reductase
MTTLQNKVALVTGGSRRIGASTVRMLHQYGMNLVVHYRRSANEAEALRAELCDKRPDSVMLVRGDLSEIAKVRNLVRKSAAEMGRLDALINNASAFFPTPISSATDDQWQSIMDTNLKAPFFLSQAAAPWLRKSRGSIINITDIYADRPLADHPIYSASKAGLVSLTKSLASELGPEIRVNAVAPGAIMWPENDNDEISHQRLISRTPLKSIGDPDDIARAVRFLLADADFITGQVLRVDGGRTVVP